MNGRAARCAFAALVAGALGAALLVAPPARAHGYLLETSPPNESVVPAAPREVRLVFSEPVDFGRQGIRLLDARGHRIATPRPLHASDRRLALLPFPRGLPRGTYVVAWQVVSSDSHPFSGGFSFSVGAPSASVVAPAVGSSRAVGLLDATARWLGFAALALSAGGTAFLLGVWPAGRRSRSARRLLGTGLGALTVSTLVLLLLQGPAATGGSLVDAFRPSLLDFTLSTRFGHALAARLALTVALALVVAGALAGRLRGTGAALAAGACVVGLVLTWTLSDHSSTGVQTWLGVPAASVHLLAMALWLGGLAFVVLFLRRRDVEERAAVLRRVSRLGLLSFAALAASGVYLAWRQVGTLAALTATGFGQLLVAKSAIALGIVALAALSRAAVRRRRPARRLGGTVAGEVLLGAAVLAVTAVLVDAVPARIAYAPPVSLVLRGPAGATVEVKVKPAKAGDNVADVYLVGSDGFLLTTAEVTGRLGAPDGGSAGRAVELTQAEPGHFVASRLPVPYRGRWTLDLVVNGTRLAAPLEIR